MKRRRAFLAQHRALVQETIARWTEALALISAKVEFYDEWVASGVWRQGNCVSSRIL